MAGQVLTGGLILEIPRILTLGIRRRRGQGNKQVRIADYDVCAYRKEKYAILSTFSSNLTAFFLSKPKHLIKK